MQPKLSISLFHFSLVVMLESLTSLVRLSPFATQVGSIRLRTSGSVLRHTDSLMVISPISR